MRQCLRKEKGINDQGKRGDHQEREKKKSS